MEQGIFYDRTQMDTLPGELWLPVPESVIPGVKPYYYISNKGRIWSTYHNRLLKPDLNEFGYLMITLVRYDMKPIRIGVHRLEMLVFYHIIGYDDLYVNHIDGDKTNNDLSNLEWSTPSENEIHAYRTGLKSTAKGEDSPLAKHTEQQIRIICECLVQKLPFKECAIRAGMEPTKASTDYISAIKEGRLWGHISCEYPIPNGRNDQVFSDDEIHHICKLVKDGLTNDKEILKIIRPNIIDLQYDRCVKAIYMIRNGYYYRRISCQYF